MKNKFVVYTALFGDYDDLIDPKENYEGCDFICFTDQKYLKSDIWEIRVIEEYNLPPNMMNRKYKIHPHIFLSDYEWSMYIHANIVIIGNPYELAKEYLTKFDIVVPKHFERKCIYEEAKECIILGKSNFFKSVNQMKKYKNKGFPKNFGMGENNIILRKHHQGNIVKIMNAWWDELSSETKRDQFSLGYVLWINKSSFNFMKQSARNNNQYFKYQLHKGIQRNINNSIFIRIKRFIVNLLVLLKVITL